MVVVVMGILVEFGEFVMDKFCMKGCYLVMMSFGLVIGIGFFVGFGKGVVVVGLVILVVYIVVGLFVIVIMYMFGEMVVVYFDFGVFLVYIF